MGTLRIGSRRSGLRYGRQAVALGVVVLALATSAVPSAAADEVITGTAVTSGGNGSTTQEWTYSSPGLLGTGTLHTDFTIDFSTTPATTTGVPVLTRADGATLSGTGSGTVDISQFPYPVTTTFTMANGTGALAGVTAVVVLTGTSGGPGVTGDVFTMSGSLTTQGAPQPTAEAFAACEGETGLIVLSIADQSQETYDVFIDGFLVDPEVTDTGGEPFVYETSEDGSYPVDVYWIEGDVDILNAQVDVDCQPDATTTPTAPQAEAVRAEPTFPG
jgi:hypothetical protein